MNYSVDLTWGLDFIKTFSLACVPIAAGILVPKALAWLHIATDAAAANRIQTGVVAMSDKAIDEISSVSVEKFGTVETHNAAVAKVVATATDGLKNAMALTGVTPESLAARVSGAVIAKQGIVPAKV